MVALATKLSAKRAFFLLVALMAIIIVIRMVNNYRYRRRFGILFANTSNLGDDVQTIAQMQFIPKGSKTIIVDRENLDKEKRRCNVIMNGWWMHNDKNFPPRQNINPLYIAFHIEKKGLVSVSYTHLTLPTNREV